MPGLDVGDAVHRDVGVGENDGERGVQPLPVDDQGHVRLDDARHRLARVDGDRQCHHARRNEHAREYLLHENHPAE